MRIESIAERPVANTEAARPSDGSLEALKWLALLLMTGDHVNKYLFNANIPGLFEAARMCLPIFVFVLAANLARPGTLANGAYGRTARRLAVAGAVAMIPYTALGIAAGGLVDGWWPLNVMFTLCVLTLTIWLVEEGGALLLVVAGIVFLVGGSLVEYWWPAIVLGLAVWRYFKRPSLLALAVGLLACMSLRIINGNWWAMAALPLIVAATRINVPMPRLRWVFYLYYPLHLAALLLLRTAGYVF